MSHVMPEFNTVWDINGCLGPGAGEDWEKRIFNFVERCVVSWQI